MPKKLPTASTRPVQVDFRLEEWGTAIRNGRLRQRLKAQDVCERVGMTHTTLRRLERGDPGAGVGLYLAVFHLLGMLDHMTPPVAPELLAEPGVRRVQTLSVDILGPFGGKEDIFGDF